MPLGSCSEKTKHENASLNSGPQGPCAIPPRQGQSQLISPVSGLKAPPDAPFEEPSPPSPSPSCSPEASVLPLGASLSLLVGLNVERSDESRTEDASGVESEGGDVTEALEGGLEDTVGFWRAR